MLLLCLCLAADPFTVRSAEPAVALDALFTRTPGWIGADGNYSVTLTPQRTLWFHSDTWLGEVDNGKRKNPKMINNSVGVMTTTKAGREVKHYWGGTQEKPAAWLTPDDVTGWLWPVGGVAANGKAMLLLWQMEKAPGAAAFGFRHVAVRLAVIDNPQDDPPQWRVKQSKLPFTELGDERRVIFGAAAMTHDGDAYFYGTIEKPKEKGFGRHMILARVKAGDIRDFEKWQFRTAFGWSQQSWGVEPLVKDVASEYSVHRMGERFVLVTHEPFLSPRIVARTAPDPWGPWSAPGPLFTCPEAKGSKTVFCYSGKAHAGLSSKDELVLTYAANAKSLGEVIGNAQLYWPRFVTIKLGGP